MDPLIHGAIFGRTIMILSSNPQSRDVLAGHFQSFECRVHLAADPILAVNHLETTGHVDGIVVEIQEMISEAFDFVDAVVTDGHQAPPIFLVTDKIDGNFDEAFYRGVEAVFFRPLDLDEMIKGIAYSIEVFGERVDRKHTRRRLRRARVEFLNEATGLASSGHVTNISKGGMYVTSMYNQPGLLQMVKFKLVCDHQSKLEVSGRGIVKWSRAKSEYGRPPGFGFEFKDLTPEALAAIEAYLAED